MPKKKEEKPWKKFFKESRFMKDKRMTAGERLREKAKSFFEGEEVENYLHKVFKLPHLIEENEEIAEDFVDFLDAHKDYFCDKIRLGGKINLVDLGGGVGAYVLSSILQKAEKLGFNPDAFRIYMVDIAERTLDLTKEGKFAVPPEIYDNIPDYDDILKHIQDNAKFIRADITKKESLYEALKKAGFRKDFRRFHGVICTNTLHHLLPYELPEVAKTFIGMVRPEYLEDGVSPPDRIGPSAVLIGDESEGPEIPRDSYEFHLGPEKTKDSLNSGIAKLLSETTEGEIHEMGKTPFELVSSGEFYKLILNLKKILPEK